MKRLILTVVLSLTLVSSACAASFTINIPNDKAQVLIDAYASVYEYQETIDEQPNPETKAQFAKRMILKQVKDTVLYASDMESQKQHEVIYLQKRQQAELDTKDIDVQ